MIQTTLITKPTYEATGNNYTALMWLNKAYDAISLLDRKVTAIDGGLQRLSLEHHRLVDVVMQMKDDKQSR